MWQKLIKTIVSISSISWSIVGYASSSPFSYAPVGQVDWNRFNHNYNIAATAENMSYTEYDYVEKNQWGELDSEKGTMPGISLGGGYQGVSGKLPYWVAGDVNLIGGHTTYDGYLVNLATLHKTPYVDKTANTKVNANIKLGIPINGGNPLSNWQLTPYITAGYQYWLRNLTDKKEIYTNVPVGGGLRFQYQTGLRWIFELDGSYAPMTMSNIKIQEDDFSKSLGRNGITNGGLKITYRVNPLTGVYFGYNYQSFQYSKSDSQYFYYQNKLREMYEPESKTYLNQFGLGVQFSY